MIPLKIFTYIKDEEDIIESWIQYHKEICEDYSNLFIVDNGSTDGTRDILEKYQELGVNVYQHGDYKKKGLFLSQVMNDNKADTKFLVPIDGDEFLVLWKICDKFKFLMEKHPNLLNKMISTYPDPTLNPRFYINYYSDLKNQSFDEKQGIWHWNTHGKTEGRFPNEINLRYYQSIRNKPLDEILTQIDESHFNAEQMNQLTQLYKSYQTQNKSYDICANTFEINRYFRQLDSKPGRFSFKFYLNSVPRRTDYTDPSLEIDEFSIGDAGRLNKKFFSASRFKATDHGNHYGWIKDDRLYDYATTDLALIHYHERGDKKTLQRVINDVKGLGNMKSIPEMINIANRRSITGWHNVDRYLRLTGHLPEIRPEEWTADVKSTAMIDRIRKFKKAKPTGK